MAVNVNVIGRLGRDAEVVNGQKGQFLSFSLATDEFKNGEKGTAWLRVNYNNTRLAEWLKKGRMVNVIGTETVRTYQDKNNQTQIGRDVNAVSVEFVNVGSGQTDSNVSSEKTAQKPTVDTSKLDIPITTGKLTPPPSKNTDVNESADDDLPF